jgi:hypothetical protein
MEDFATVAKAGEALTHGCTTAFTVAGSLLHARQAQQTTTWWLHYSTRAGIEATIGQGIRRCGPRRTRYRGLEKTRTQPVLTAAALDLIRADAWLTGTPLATTRPSQFTRLHPA